MVTTEKKTKKTEVEKILEKRSKKGITEYLVKWKNEDDPDWVSQNNLETAKMKIQEYENSLTSEQDYEIEKILEKRVHKGKLQYFVKWKNFDETTWEPLSHLKDVRDMIDEFEKKQVCDWLNKSFCLIEFILRFKRRSQQSLEGGARQLNMK